MNSIPPSARSQPEPVVARPSASIAGRVVVLVVATIGVLLAITAAADIRRHQQAMDQARWHAGVLSGRMGSPPVLPLNLEPANVPERLTQSLALESATSDEVLALRSFQGAAIASSTVPQHMRLAPDGRAVVLFENGLFRVEWMTLGVFQERLDAQRDYVSRASASGAMSPTP